jgi:hypothetical protein
MSSRVFWSGPVVRNLAGVIVLLLAWYLPDRFFFAQREGFQKILPYILLLTMYGWIVFHNRVLLERLYLSGKKGKYFLNAGLVMLVGSVNIFLVIHYVFPGRDPSTQILGFWVFTIAGTGIYLFARPQPQVYVPIDKKEIANFDFTAEDRHHSLPVDTIIYIESLENYVRVITVRQTFLVRMSLKQAEQTLSPVFIRISRSHLVNRNRIESLRENEIIVSGRELKIGKVYKKYVSELITNP